MSNRSLTVTDSSLTQAAQWLIEADAIMVGAGAGMGVDSGLPDFRGPEGFWRAYPHFRDRQLRFEDLANPRWFYDDPGQAWGFYGHRYLRYRDCVPHNGFKLLRDWMKAKPLPGFVFTSNVDGQFQSAGFAAEEVYECHGSIHYLQCSRACHGGIWAAQLSDLVVDEARLYATAGLPLCPRCGQVARPNILMFGDGEWLAQRSDEQWRAFNRWQQQLAGQRLVIIELGAGLAVPTVRYQCESIADHTSLASGQLIRINPRDTQVPVGHMGLAGGALEVLEALALKL